MIDRFSVALTVASLRRCQAQPKGADVKHDMEVFYHTAGVFSRLGATRNHRLKIGRFIELACAAMIFTVIFGILIGTVSAVKRNQPVGHALRVFSILGVSMPVFWLGLILLLVFYFLLEWLPGSARHSLFVFPERITPDFYCSTVFWRAIGWRYGTR